MSEDDVRLIPADDSSWRFEAYLRRGGYEAARKAVTSMAPQDVIAEVRRAGLRGRGGAGFPAGLKWSFVPQCGTAPKYLCVNADEGEPGTFKDRAILVRNPHQLLEGMIIAAFGVGIRKAFIYVRGEYARIARRLEEALAEARERGFLGRGIFGSDFDLEVIVHVGAGAYICGEETALLESVEGRRGQPRFKPPFPAVVGLFRSPTVINNVETLANIPSIIGCGADWFTARGLPKDGGTRLFGVSGAVRRPGLYELPMGTPLRTIVETHAGGPPEGVAIKAVVPGGLSAPVLRPDELDVPMDFDSLAKAGSMLGTAGIVVIGDRTPIIEVLKVTARFYAHESCGQCTPCRIGTSWIHKTVTRIGEGQGRLSDLDLILRLAEGMKGRTLCPMGDAAALPIHALVSKFRDELEQAVSR
ncbi:MAG: NADH-quinone oxidoreductase subunit NuoF [Acidobacteria bacterium]|nr:NADH-quinone oxidoreductase subunit NuoF [Acidobacteriota bacterium]MBE3125774.1 NADH-quinone oxidoreductase subunit NuoF [Acidobacteriota bacterium]